MEFSASVGCIHKEFKPYPAILHWYCSNNYLR